MGQRATELRCEQYRTLRDTCGSSMYAARGRFFHTCTRQKTRYHKYDRVMYSVRPQSIVSNLYHVPKSFSHHISFDTGLHCSSLAYSMTLRTCSPNPFTVIEHINIAKPQYYATGQSTALLSLQKIPFPFQHQASPQFGTSVGNYLLPVTSVQRILWESASLHWGIVHSLYSHPSTATQQ